jgi:methylmalonyl-CoA mutase cobalamin-binding subunit
MLFARSALRSARGSSGLPPLRACGAARPFAQLASEDGDDDDAAALAPTTTGPPPRIVTAASLFDGHDASINVMRRLIQANGAEVIHLAHDRSALDVVNAIVQEDAHAVALTSYQVGTYAAAAAAAAAAATAAAGAAGGAAAAAAAAAGAGAAAAAAARCCCAVLVLARGGD